MAYSWDKWLLAAYFRQVGLSQLRVSKLVGTSKSTIEKWEHTPDKWVRACNEARVKWLEGITIDARMALAEELKDKSNKGRGRLALDLLERVDPDLAPATRRIEMDWKVRMIERLDALPVVELERIGVEAGDEECIAYLGPGDEPES